MADAKQVNWNKVDSIGGTLKGTAHDDKTTATRIYTDRKSGWIGRCPQYYSPHPDYPGLGMVAFEMIGEEADTVTVRLDYESWTGQFNNSETKRYDLEDTTSEESIIAHPRYQSLSVAEKKALQSIGNGAEFDENNQLYESFITSDRGKECLGKIRDGGGTHYLVPGVVWVERFTSVTLSSLNLANVGKIDTPPGSPPSTGGKNWLYTGARASATADGRAFQIERQWRLSGRRPWDPVIYGPDDS